MLRCCTFSCSCTHTSCYAVEAADAADDDGGCDDDEEEEEELVDETSVFFLFNSTVARLSETRHLVFDAYVKIFQVEKTFAF